MENRSINIPDGGFLQSEHWERFQRVLGRKAVRIEDWGNSALAIEYKLPLVGGYFFVPRGPIINQSLEIKNQNDNEKIKIFFHKIIDAAKAKKIGWVRIEPQREDDLEVVRHVCNEMGVRLVKAKKNHQPPETIMIDLDKSEDELLNQMKSKTRYNIRLSQKKGVEVFSSRTFDDIEAFCKLTRQTGKRDKIVMHSAKYYKEMIKEISPAALELLVAKYNNEIIAANIVSFHGGVATYLHGASADSQRNAMAPYLLQWESIKKAKQLGCSKYDLGGIRSRDLSNPAKASSWAGITRFKLGFCQDCLPVLFPGCYDIIIDKKKYWLYRALQSAKDCVRAISRL